MHSHSTDSSNEERTEEYFKKFDREKILKYLIKEKNPVIFDVGANIGTSLAEFKGWWPESMVHCFEPQEECWDLLEKEAAQYPADETIINKHAVGSFINDKAKFYSHEITSGQSGFNKINTNSLDSIHLKELNGSDEVEDYKETLNHERLVKISRLDDYMKSTEIKNVNLLKIDTQGYEPEVLDGMGQQLSHVDVVLTELMFYDYYERSLSFSDIEKFLLPAGFHLYDINHISKNPMNGRTDWVDVIYVNNKFRTRNQSA